MAPKKGLFDDESDEEFVPGQNQAQAQAASSDYNPYGNEYAQNNQQQQYDALDEDEYQPTYQYEQKEAPTEQYTQQQPHTEQITTEAPKNYEQQNYQEQAMTFEETKETNQAQDSGHPIGFGAGNSSEAQETNQEEKQPVVPDETTQSPTQKLEEEVKMSAEKTESEAKPEKAENKIMDEINKLFTEQNNHKVDDNEFTDEQLHYTVTNPQKVGSVIKYTVIGQDKEGRFEVQRRFNEFFALRQALNQRWPGCYVPCLPEKKMTGADDAFIEERRQLLERFLRELAKFKFIIESEEFAMFSRGQGEVNKALENKPKQRPLEILEKYRLNFKIDEDQDNSEMNKYRDKINNFTSFIRKALLQVEKQKNDVKVYMSTQDKLFKNYEKYYSNVVKYEENALDFFSDNDSSQRALTNPSASEVKDKINPTLSSWTNPFNEAYIWIKGEYLDLCGARDCMNGRDQLVSVMTTLEGTKRSKQTELEKMTTGKTTLKSFFKTKSTIEKDIVIYHQEVEQMTKDIEDYRKLINFVTIYHGNMAIELFKMNKQQQYCRMLNNFAVREISNAHIAATLYHQLLELQEKK